MSARDIIAAALRADERIDHGPDDGMDGWALAAENVFITTFDPKHVALMEAESEAVASLIAEMVLTVARGGRPHEAFMALIACHNRLTDYRNERAL